MAFIPTYSELNHLTPFPSLYIYIETGSVIFLRVKPKVMRLKNHPENQG